MALKLPKSSETSVTTNRAVKVRHLAVISDLSKGVRAWGASELGAPYPTVKRGNFEEILRFLGCSFQRNACMVLKLAIYNILHPKKGCAKLNRPRYGFIIFIL